MAHVQHALGGISHVMLPLPIIVVVVRVAERAIIRIVRLGMV